MSIWLMLGLFLVLANLPWIGDRVFFVYPLEHKSNWIRLFELTVYFFISLGIGIAFEIRFAGEVYTQGWEFFVTVLSLFLVLSVPGVVYRYQWLPMQYKFK
ncbi:MAG: hypothetical protein CMH22_11625 [Methylophaga sp.]|uniref:DUF2818 family protein n=1 Tax=Methylophaga sp. UBA678 TaxID=1946901 RepID=UPI000C676228|nr:DUF2818 family protein [Methylophaga sp. UBA678]MAX52621.1 hypothetical protein [Methylophaga sp.]